MGRGGVVWERRKERRRWGVRVDDGSGGDDDGGGCGEGGGYHIMASVGAVGLVKLCTRWK